MQRDFNDTDFLPPREPMTERGQRLFAAVVALYLGAAGCLLYLALTALVDAIRH